MLTLTEMVLLVAERIRADKVTNRHFSDSRITDIALVTLGSLANNIAAELRANGIATNSDRAGKIADAFLKACGDRIGQVTP